MAFDVVCPERLLDAPFDWEEPQLEGTDPRLIPTGVHRTLATPVIDPRTLADVQGISVAPRWDGSGTTAIKWLLDFRAWERDWMYGLTDAMRRAVLLSLLPAPPSKPLKEMVNRFQFRYQDLLREVTEEVFTEANDDVILKAFHTVKPSSLTPTPREFINFVEQSPALGRRVRNGITQRQAKDRLLDVIATIKVDGLLKEIIKEETKVGLEFNYLEMIVFVKSHVDPPSQDHPNRPGRRSTAWSKNIWEASTKTKSHAPPSLTSPRRPVGMSRKARKIQRVSAAARELGPLPPDSILNSILPRSAVMSQEHDFILDSILPCSPVMSQETDSMIDLRAQEEEPSLDRLIERVRIEQNCGNPLPSSDLPEVCEPRLSKVSFAHPRAKKVSLQDRISDWSKSLQNASPSELTSEESQTLSLKANDRPLPFSGISGDPVTILRTRDRCVRSVIEADAEHPHCQDYRDWIYNQFKDTVFKEGGNHWSEIEKNMDKRGPNGICVLEPIPDAEPKADKPIRAVGLREEAMREKKKRVSRKGLDCAEPIPLGQPRVSCAKAWHK